MFIRKIALILAGYFDSVTFVFPKLMPLAGFALYPLITGTPLSASIAFSIISLYKIVESSIFYMPWILASCAQLEASYTRITHFLSLEEMEEELTHVRKDFVSWAIQLFDQAFNQKLAWIDQVRLQNSPQMLQETQEWGNLRSQVENLQQEMEGFL